MMTDEKITLPVGYVAIPVEEYVDLVETNDRHDTLLNVLYDNATLSWNKSHLTFHDEKVSTVLDSISSRYFRVLKDLKKEAELQGEVNNAETRTDNN